MKTDGVFAVMKWLERLSLDAVLVAVIWAWALGGAAHVIGVEILALSTWLTYVADRLWEVRPGREAPDTDRHRYYQRHYKFWLVLWLACFLATVTFALTSLPFWKWAGGWGLVAGIALYLHFLGQPMKKDGRLRLKRSAVPLIFAAGVAWMSESWREPVTLLGTAVLLCGAWTNVILVTAWESKTGQIPVALRLFYRFSIGGLAVLGMLALLIDPATGAAAFSALSVYGLLHLLIKREGSGNLRVVADLVLILAGLVLIVFQS